MKPLTPDSNFHHMVKAVLIILALILSFGAIKCALITKIFKITGNSGDLNSPEKLEKVVSAIFEENLCSAKAERGISLFHLLYPVIASFSGISENDQYKFYIDALFQYMNKACLSAIMKIKREQLTLEERTEIIQKISLTINETAFFYGFKSKLTVPDRTNTFMLNVLKSVPVGYDSFDICGMILKLAPFCESEACQEIVYSSILDSLEDQTNVLPLLSMKYNLKDTDKYDAFIMSCYEIYKLERPNIIPLDIFISNIITGPGTVEASLIFLNIINKDILIKFSRSKQSTNNLSRFLFNSRIFDQFYEQFLSDEDENIVALKIRTLKFKENYDAILAMHNDSAIQASDVIFKEYIDIFRNHKDALKEYNEIDPYFVAETVRRFNFEIIELIRYFDSITDATRKLITVCVSFTILNAIPNVHLIEYFAIDYEFLLDAFLNPDVLALNLNVAVDHISKVITIPYAKLELSTLDKVLVALKQCTKHDPEERFHIAVTMALYWRYFDDKIFFKAFATVVEFYESNHLEMNSIVLPLLMKFLCDGEYYLARYLIKFCREKKLLPKIFEIVANRYLGRGY